ncbi:hydantoinase B/oxoprolinase family protein [Paraburkholderia sp.]|uniref:hydantoinase B/oxoprolinase family protein n=1 Tax=Paraburkholderia sp. TaxID=1926495 RepID=UPI0025D2F0A1|nr:hydantoinase B/oxoprolinase family protein [Paraburkholderia sp.]
MSSNQAKSEQDIVREFVEGKKAFLAPDAEIMRNHHIAPRSAWEEEALAQGMNTDLYAEIRTQLQAALDETFDLAELTVASPAAQCGDMSTAIFTAKGDMAVCSNRGVAGFSVSLHYPIRFIAKYFENDPTVGVREGDAFLINDCRYGGIHSPDQHLFMPVFSSGKLISWVCCALHEGEVGARTPGGMGPMIESKWDEGFKGSPLKLVENYRIKTDVLTLVQNNSREPYVILADIKARLAACRTLEKRMKEAVVRYGETAMVGFLRGSIELLRDEVKRRLRELPDGTVRVRMFMDETTREPMIARIPLTFNKQGDRLVIDMRGCGPQFANRSINSLLQTQLISLAIALSHHVWPDLQAGPALVDCVDVLTDRNSLLDCDNEVPVALCMMAAFKAISSYELAFSKFYYGVPRRYGKVKAAWFNQPQMVIYGGLTQHFDTVGNACADLNGMGGGAKCDEDGEHSPSPNFGAYTDLGEAEHTEQNLPYISVISKRLWPDNHGFGKYRGGAGYQMGFMRAGTMPFGFQTFVGGSYFPSTSGLFGGYACPVYSVCTIRGKNLLEDLRERPHLFNANIEDLMNKRPFEGATYTAQSMSVPFDLYKEGELFMMSQGGGGGYGDVLERDPARVVKDLEEGLVSMYTARELYGVICDEQTFLLDPVATEARRAEIRAQRKQRGMKWDDFVREHVRATPPEGVQYFGVWNDAPEVYAGPYGTVASTEACPPLHMPDPMVLENARLKARIAELEAKAHE